VSSLTISQRTKIRTEILAKSIEDTLSVKLLPGTPATPSALAGALRAWRRLGRLKALPIQRRLDLRQRFVEAFADSFGALGIKPSDFNAPDLKTLAETWVAMLERSGYGQIRVTNLPARRGHFAGELLEQLVHNHGDLQKEFIDLAEAQRKLLDETLDALVDATGTPVPALKGKFGAVRKATDIMIVDGPKKKGPKLPPRKFMDLARVSEFEHEAGSGPQLVSFLVETEIGMPPSARGKGKQVGRAQVRYHFGLDEELHMVVEGHPDPVILTPKQIVFAPRAINRTVVTISPTEFFKLSYTERGGYPEVFWRIGIAIRTQEIWRLVDIALP
jgi:hypothetical protein